MLEKSRNFQFAGIALMVLSIFFNSCGDCQQRVSGTILDNETKKPIDSAYIYKAKMNYNNTFSDNKGNFSIESISGGLFSCPPMKVIIVKNGYEKDSMEIKNENHSIIYLRKKSKTE